MSIEAERSLIISNGNLKYNQLAGNVALVTGAGGGIGYETARSLLWLGIKVVIAEINKEKGKKAEIELNAQFGKNSALFIHVDIGNAKSVKKLAKEVIKRYGKLDILINNATITPIGAVHRVTIQKWDSSYQTNLRGPVLLVNHFLPQMLERNSGIIVFVPSSGAAPYMGAYEVFKTAQVELSNTLAAELENTGVVTFAIGPGLVKTETANTAIQEIAPLYGKSVAEFYKMSENVLITAAEAGAGFAVSVALASQYRGTETSSIQALMDAGIPIGKPDKSEQIQLTDAEKEQLSALLHEIRKTFMEQLEGWKNRPVFERQWVLRDFKKHTGYPPEYFVDKLKEIGDNLQNGLSLSGNIVQSPLEKLSVYYSHQIDLLKGYEKDPEKVKEYSEIMNQWISKIDEFTKLTLLLAKKYV